MTKTIRWTIAIAGLWAVTASAADVHVGINLGIPAPPIVVAAPPRLVVVPGAPTVQYAPDLQLNYFSYGGQYYAYNDGGWFTAHDVGAPWVYLPRPRVPRALLAVPAGYYRVPPGHHHRDWDRGRHDDRHDRGRHRGHGRR